jgi:hypothetical protein
MCSAVGDSLTLAKQTIQFDFDTELVWNRVRSRYCVFLDTNAWIHMSDNVDETASRVRATRQAMVASGKLFCPVSWGSLEELFLQAGESLQRTATLMEELSLNACFIMRTEAGHRTRHQSAIGEGHSLNQQ